MLVRPAQPRDYPEIERILRASAPTFAGTSESVLHSDRVNPDRQRYVVEDNGAILGQGHRALNPGSPDPRKFLIGIHVAPEYRLKGAGSRMFEHIMRELQPSDPLNVRGQAPEDQIEGVPFLERRGFRKETLRFQSVLDLSRYEARSPGAPEGFRLTTLAELPRTRELHAFLKALHEEAIADIPNTDPEPELTLEQFSATRLDREGMPPEAYFLAMDGDTPVGLSFLIFTPGTDQAMTGLTGTLRAYRRRGIAHALKLRGLNYAKKKGYKTVGTWNDSANAPMLGANMKLGFERRSGVWIMIREFKLG